ncbi:hypothetical protein [Melittangium boletus]|uniref:hypothetical protein n=1 Tax=Melittangium boletus TaxID=83453 RepID=UPI003DA320D2
MANGKRINWDESILSLNPFIEGYEDGSKEKELFKLAQAALLYIRDRKNEEDFAKYYDGFSNTSFTVEVSHEFATREEADAWLASGIAQHKERVKIAGKGFMAVQSHSGRWYLMIAPLPEELNSEEWRDDSED